MTKAARLPTLDATRGIVLEINQGACSTGRQGRKAKQADAFSCVLARGFNALAGIDHVIIDRNVTRINWAGERHYTRYINAKVTRDHIIAYDLTGHFPPGLYVFEAPVGVRTLDFINSQEMKALRIKSAMSRLALAKKGIPPRGKLTPSPTEVSYIKVRNGSGKR